MLATIIGDQTVFQILQWSFYILADIALCGVIVLGAMIQFKR